MCDNGSLTFFNNGDDPFTRKNPRKYVKGVAHIPLRMEGPENKSKVNIAQ